MKDLETSEMVAIPASESKESSESTMSPNPESTADGVSVSKEATPIPETNDDAIETNGEVVATNVDDVSIDSKAEETNVETVATDSEVEATKVKSLATIRVVEETNDESLAANKEAVTTDVEPMETDVEPVVINGATVVEENKESSVDNGEKVTSQPNVGIKRTKGSFPRDLKKIRLIKDSDEEDDPDDPLPQVNGNSSNDRIQNELQKKIENIPEKTKAMEKAQTEGIMVLEEANEVLQANDDKENTINKKQETKLKKQLRRLSRKELENMIIKKLNEKIINQHELGHLKALSEKLKYTLENNKKKTAQFYKEVDDLKKVTQKLMQDHRERKGQYVTPIRTQRSVGIHANEKYIRQGSMFVSNGTGPYKTISPTPGLSKITTTTPAASASVGPLQSIQTSTPTNSTIQTQMSQPVASSTPVQTYRAVNATSSSGSTQILRQNLMVQPGQAGPTRPVVMQPLTYRPPMVQVPRPPMVSFPRPPMVSVPSTPQWVSTMGVTPMVQVPRSAVAGAVCSSNTNTVNSAGSSLMSLGSNRISAQIVTPPQGNQISTIGNLHVRTTPNTVVNAPVPGIGTTVRPVTIQTPGGGTQQVLLLQQIPTNGGIPNTILVSNAGSTVTTGLTTTLVNNTQHSTLNNPPSAIGSFASMSAVSPPSGAYVAAANVVATATSQVIPRHPAPLPSHKLSVVQHSPPILTLKKVAGKENSIVLSWNMSKADNHSSIGNYHLFSYQETTAPPISKLWKRVGTVQALELPMACTLTQFTPGHVYHFAVRAVYGAERVGPFSEPRSIHLPR